MILYFINSAFGLKYKGVNVLWNPLETLHMRNFKKYSYELRSRTGIMIAVRILFSLFMKSFSISKTLQPQSLTPKYSISVRFINKRKALVTLSVFDYDAALMFRGFSSNYDFSWIFFSHIQLSHREAIISIATSHRGGRKLAGIQNICMAWKLTEGTLAEETLDDKSGGWLTLYYNLGRKVQNLILY